MENLPQRTENKSFGIGLPIDRLGLPIQVEKALICHSFPRIATMGNNHEPVKAVLAQVFSIIGLRPEQYPSGVEKSLLISLIFEKLGNYTCQDIAEAFKMAAAKELEVDVRHFQNFNFSYLATVMSAYRDWLNHCQREQAKAQEREAKLQNLNAEPSDEEKKRIELEFAKTMVIEPFEAFKKTGRSGIVPGAAKLVFKWLERNGFMLIERPERDEIARATFQAFMEYKEQEKKHKPRTLSEHLKQKEAGESFQAFEAKKEAYLEIIEQNFKRLKDSGIEIKTDKK